MKPFVEPLVRNNPLHTIIIIIIGQVNQHKAQMK
jgi:hypothetical protein